MIAVVSEDARLTRALDGLPLQLVINPTPEAGLSSSIRLGLDTLPASVAAVLIAAADLPFLAPAQVRRLTSDYTTGAIVVSRYGERTGNPQVYDRRFIPELREITGDLGGRVLAERYPELVIESEFEKAAGEDIDTPEDWDRVRRSR